MSSVCDCCVAAYCSCVAASPAAAQLRKLELLLAQQGGDGGGLLKVDFQKSWEVWNGGDCEVHGRCSFCNRLLSQSGKNERSVKRKFARMYAEEVVFSSLVREEDAKKMCEQNEQVRRLMEALEAEREIVSALSVELEEERNAAAVAATETLAMITRLQEEKAAVQMEASQYKRMVEERTQYDKGVLAKQEEERMALSKEVEMYRSSLAGGKKRACSSSVESGGAAGDGYATPLEGGERGRNLMESFERVEHGRQSPPRVYSPSRGVGFSRMDIDEEARECSGSSGIHDLREVSGRATTSGGRSEHEFMEKYGPRWRSSGYSPSPLKNSNSSRSYGSVSSSSGLYSTSVSRDDQDDAVDHIVRAMARPNGKLSEELRELSWRLRALEADRDYHAFGGPRRGGGSGEMEILEEISQQLRHIQAMDRKPDDVKELSEASFVFSFKGFFSFNGLRQSLNSNINRLACMFLKHTDAAGLNYGDHHVGLSHLLESSPPRKTPRAVPCITRGIKVDTPPLFSNSSCAVLHRQNVEWPMDARGRAETAFGGWDY